LERPARCRTAGFAVRSFPSASAAGERHVEAGDDDGRMGEGSAWPPSLARTRGPRRGRSRRRSPSLPVTQHSAIIRDRLAGSTLAQGNSMPRDSGSSRERLGRLDHVAYASPLAPASRRGAEILDAPSGPDASSRGPARSGSRHVRDAPTSRSGVTGGELVLDGQATCGTSRPLRLTEREGRLCVSV